MKNCEKCQKEHDGSYASGRFCSALCARSFSTSEKRKEINEKVSKTLKQIYPQNESLHKGLEIIHKSYKPGSENVKRRTQNIKKTVNYELRKSKVLEYKASLRWEECSHKERTRRVKKEQGYKCNKCKLQNWNDKALTLHLHHIDGNKKNIERENLVFLCPNCHSQTDNWCVKNRKDFKYSSWESNPHYMI